MNLFIALAICALAQVPVPAVAPGADITGTWNVTTATPQGDIASVLTLKKDADKYVGTISSEMGESPVEAAVKEKAVSIYFAVQTPNGNLDIVLNGTIDGETMKGTMDLATMGQFEWTAKRQAAAAASPAPAAPPAGAAPAATQLDVSGTWGLDVATDAGSGTPTLTLKQDGEKLTGQYVSNQFGTAQLTGTLKGTDISFAFDISAEGNAMHVVYTGTVDKDTMKGSVNFGGMGSGTFTGKKR